MASVRPATTNDLPRIGRALAAAFETDPIWHWLTPDIGHYRRRAPAFFAADAKLKLTPHGRVLVSDDLGGCAVWCAPDHWKGTLAETARMLAPSGRLLGRRLLDGVRAIGAMEKVHPKDPPHWYLSVLGTDPDHQGKGIGSALIRAVTDECDRELVVCDIGSAACREHVFAQTACAREHEGRTVPTVHTITRDEFVALIQDESEPTAD